MTLPPKARTLTHTHTLPYSPHDISNEDYLDRFS